MNIEIYNWCDVDNYSQQKYADLVASYTQGLFEEKPQMIPMTVDDINNKRLGAVALLDDDFAGYISAAQPLAHNQKAMAEIGTLWVPNMHRRKGVAHELVNHITKKATLLDLAPFAFCNPSSNKVFIDNGYTEVSSDEIPVESFSLCSDCPMKPSSGCCDVTLIYNGDNND